MTSTVFFAIAASLAQAASCSVDLVPAPAAVYGGTVAERIVLVRNAGATPLVGECIVENASLGLRVERSLEVAPGDVARVPVRYLWPDVSSIVRYTLDVNVRGADPPLAATFALAVYPSALRDGAFASHTKTLALYDMEFSVGRLFEYVGVEPLRIATLKDLSGIDVLILGRDACAARAVRAPERIDILRRFVQEGGVIVTLPQTEPLPFLPEPLPISATPALALEAVAAGDPLFRGVSDEDLRDWGGELGPGGIAPRARVGERVYFTDAAGWSMVVAYEIGQGLVIACQMDLARWIEEAPPAALIAEGITQLAIDPRFDALPVGLLDDGSGATARLLDSVGLAWGRVNDASPVTAFEVVVIDATAAGAVPVADLKPAIAFGARAVILGATGGTAPFCAELCGARVSIVDATVTKLARGAPYKQIKGIPGAFLDWGGVPVASGRVSTDAPSGRPLLVCTGHGPDWAGLLEVPAGHGRVVVSTIRHGATREGRAILARLLTNLDAERR